MWDNIQLLLVSIDQILHWDNTMLSADGRQRLDPFLAKHRIILSGVEGQHPGPLVSFSLIFSVSGDKCQARLNCYANTDSQIIPILVPSPSPSIIHHYHHPTDYIIKASHTEGWGGKESWKNCGVYLRLVIAEIQCNGAIDWHINQYLFAAAATYLGRDESFCFGLCL